ncbi:tetratricopeptide repeat protein [Marinigracilibium pacificum]|uniref:Tetratricopeptide repeat protein n=1 Tax=Marinigracilibium pacificum TaxID=2729599 RepID=A0A848J3S8_9BACT|nr:tetratricopeptide repeat protein [Marinigracilibium pacificum]NMM49978.1 tetratricopeptide repeat protein [Marinigracilibium pacificum]
MSISILFIFRFLIASLLIPNHNSLEDECPAEKYLQLGLEQRKHDLYDALSSFNKGYQSAIECDEQELIVLSKIRSAEVYFMLNDIDTALSILKSNTILIQRIKNERLILQNKLALGLGYYYQGEYHHAESILKESLDLAKQIDSSFYAKALNNIGLVKHVQFQYDSALKYYLLGYEVKKRMSSQTNLASTASNIGSVYKKIGNYQEALKYLNEAIYYDSINQNPIGIAQSLNNIAAVFIDDNLPEKAIPVLLEASSKFKEYGYLRGFASTQFNLGKLYFDTKSNPLLSEAYYFSAAQIYDSLDMGENEFITYLSLVELKLSENQTEEAWSYFLKSQNKLETIDSSSIDMSKYYFINSELNKEIANYQNAYHYLKKSYELKDSLKFSEQKSRIEEIVEKQKYLLASQKLELANKEHRLEIISDRIVLVIVILILAFVIFCYIYFVQLSKRKNAEFRYSIENEKADYRRLRILELEKEQLKTLLEQKQESLLNQRSLIQEKHKILGDLGNEISEIIKNDSVEDSVIRKSIKDILKDYNKRIDFDSEKWYRRYLESSAWSEFNQKLDQIGGGLTENEKRLAILLRSDFNSKEIAIAIGVAPKTIDMSRYRLRKKIGLKTGESLVDYLKSL